MPAETAAPPGKSWELQSRAAHALARFRALFPAVFCDPPVPLKIGVHEELIALTAGEFMPDEIGAALRLWVRQPGYQKAVAAGGPRYGLDGSPAGAVADTEQAVAAKLVKQAERRQAAPIAAGPAIAPQKTPEFSMPKLTAKSLKATLVLDPAQITGIKIPDGIKQVPFSIVTEDGRTVIGTFAARSLRRVAAAAAAGNVVIVVKGRLISGDVLAEAGIEAMPKTPKPPASEAQPAAPLSKPDGRPILRLRSNVG